MSDRTAFPDLERLVQDLRADLFVRWMRRAQKQALIEWRDRKTAPGLAARFTDAGNTFYDFGQRDGRYWVRKGRLPDFVKTGHFRDQVLARKPRSSNTGTTDVVTRLSFGGGVLNFLQDVHGITGIERMSTRRPTSIAAYAYQRRGGQVSVPASVQTRVVHERRLVRAGASYSDEFGRFNRDWPWIAARTSAIFMEIFRAAAIGRAGRLRSAVFEHLDRAAA